MDKTKIFFEKNKLKILSYILLFVLLIGVANTSVYYTSLKPFGVSIVFALLYIKFNGYCLGGLYLLSSIVAGVSLRGLIVSAIISLIISLTELIISIKNFNLKKWHIFILGFLCEIMFTIDNLGDRKNSLALIVSIVLGLLFLYSSILFFEGVFKRGFGAKLNLDEKVAGGIILIIFSIGVSNIFVYNISVGLMFAVLILLVSSFISSSSLSIMIAAIMGMGFAVTTINANYIAMFIVMVVSIVSFKCNIKILSSIASVMSFVLFSIVFEGGISRGEIFSVGLGAVVFTIIPTRIIFTISDIFDIKQHVVVKNIIDKTKKHIINRVDNLSKVFADMTGVYKDMVRGVLSDDNAIALLKEELVSSVCKGCSYYEGCHRGNNSFIDNSLDILVSTSYAKNKVLLIDVPSYLTSNCNKINQLISSLNQMLMSYKDYTNAVSNLDTSRILIADQLNGVSKLLHSLSKEVDLNIHFDSRFENRIKEDLSYKNIVCLECVVYEKDIQNKYINLIVNNDCINEKIIEKVVSKIIGINMIVSSVDQSDIEGTSVVNLISRPNYDIVFGSTVVTKMGKVICGDNHSLVKIDNGKYMVSICDGMGSGDKANKVSTLTINLIENFYKAGFDNDIILSSVNKLLSLTEEEIFSTIDLCVIDCKKNTYDFIKLGATNGYIKRDKGEVEIIESNGLPVGVLESITPHTYKKLINPFDILVFMSDGVSDAFENKIDFGNYLQSLDIINPQTLSQEIVNKALELNDNIASDDMTVICVRVFEWV